MIDPMKIMHISSALNETIIETVKRFGGDPSDAVMVAEMTAAMIVVNCTKGPESDKESAALFAKHIADILPVLRKAFP